MCDIAFSQMSQLSQNSAQWNRENRLLLIEELQKHPLLWSEDDFGGVQRLDAIEQIRKSVNKIQGECPFTHRQIADKLSDLICAYNSLADKMNRDKAAGLEVKEPEWEFFAKLKFLGGLDREVEEELSSQSFVEQQFPSTLAVFNSIDQPSSQTNQEEENKDDTAPKKATQEEAVEWTDEERVVLIKEYQKHPRLWNTSHPDYLRPGGGVSEIRARCKANSLLSSSFNKLVSKPHTHQQIKAQLNALRLQYKKCLKEMEENGYSQPDWPLFNHLKFLGNLNGSHLSVPDTPKVPDNSPNDENDGDHDTSTAFDGVKWTFKKNLRLVKEYQRHPRLWSPTYSNYNLRLGARGGVIKRTQEIELITEALNKFEKKPFTYSQVLQQIRQLRMKYRSCYKAFLVDGKEPKWRLFKHLRFLDDTLGIADPKELVIKQEHVKPVEQQEHTSAVTSKGACSPQTSRRRSSISFQQDENKENHMVKIQPKISSFLSMDKSANSSSTDSNPDDVLFTQPPAKKGKQDEEEENYNKDISVLELSTSSDIWIEEFTKDKNYTLRPSTKRASLVSLQTIVNKDGTPSSHFARKSIERMKRWGGVNNLANRNPGKTDNIPSNKNSKDLHMVESFLTSNCTVESPDIVFERTSRRPSHNPINASNLSGNTHDANSRFVEFVADALKRISSVRPNRIASTRKIIKDALFDAEFEDGK